MRTISKHNGEGYGILHWLSHHFEEGTGSKFYLFAFAFSLSLGKRLCIRLCFYAPSQGF